MTGFFDSLRIELDGIGRRRHDDLPGFVATGIRENATGPTARPSGEPVKEGEVMGVEECARASSRAIERREREVIMTARGKMGLWLKLLARPGGPHREAAIEKGR
jgi:short-subunit dehydrogenase